MNQMATFSRLAFASHIFFAPVSAGAGSDHPLFGNPGSPMDSGYPIQMTAADFDGDGCVDVAMTDTRNDGELATFMGRGNGLFDFSQRFVFANGGGEVLSVDLNDDGRVDLVTSHAGTSNTVAVRFNNGDGTFDVPVHCAAGASPGGLAVADLDLDGDPDVVVANRNDHTVSVFENETQGSLQLVATLAVGERPLSVRIANLDEDQSPDILTANHDSADASILWNNGGFAFDMDARFSTGGESRDLGIADFNADSLPDFAVTLSNRQRVAVLLGTGARTFMPPFEVPVGRQPGLLSIHDFDEDGYPDIAVRTAALSDDVTVSLVRNNGDGSFASLRHVNADGVVLADTNGDDRIDLLGMNRDARTLTVVFGEGGLEFADDRTIDIDPGPITSGDVNRDGFLDLAVGHMWSERCTIALGGPEGSFAPSQTLALSSNARGITAARLNSDAYLDLGVICEHGDVHVFINDGKGWFLKGPQLDPVDAGAALASGDIDRDGDVDLVVIGNQKDLAVLVNDGTGRFVIGFTQTITPDGEDVALGDLDGDGDLDIMVGEYDDHRVYLLRNLGGGEFTAPSLTPVVGEDFAIADFDQDGDLDVAGTSTVESVVLAINDGTGWFSVAAEYPILPGFGAIFDIVATDLNADGWLDLATANSSFTVAALLNDTEGRFGPSVLYGCGSESFFLVAGDFTGDRAQDLIVSNIRTLSDAHNLSMLVNTHQNLWTTATLTSLGVRFGTLLSGDLFSLTAIDGDELVIRSALGFAASEPNLTRIDLVASSPLPAITQLRVNVRTRINQPSGSAVVSLRDWCDDRMVALHSFPVSSTNADEVIELPQAECYQRDDGRIELSLKVSVLATFSASGFKHFTDEIGIGVRDD